MNKPTPKPVLIAAFATIVVGAAFTLVIMGILLYPKQNSVSADSSAPVVYTASAAGAPDDDPIPIPPPPSVMPNISLAPVPTPRPAATPIPVVAAVRPVQPVASGEPAICHSQSYSPEREAQCPHSAPIRDVTQSELASPPTATSTPQPTPTMAPVASPSATPTTSPTLAPTVTPAPTSTPTPTPTSPPAAAPVRDCGGYPALLCDAPRDSLVDPWGMYNRECVSYAAYKVSLRRTMPNWGGHGNAFQWPGNARAAGIPVDGQPRVGDVAILTTGFGHAMYVEAVTGSYITISQFNYNNTGEFSRLVVPSAGLVFIHF